MADLLLADGFLFDQCFLLFCGAKVRLSRFKQQLPLFILLCNLCVSNSVWGNENAKGSELLFSTIPGAEIQLQVRQSVLAEILKEISIETGVVFHYLVLPVDRITANCVATILEEVLRCLLGESVNMVFQYSSQGVMAHSALPTDIWILDSVWSMDSPKIDQAKKAHPVQLDEQTLYTLVKQLGEESSIIELSKALDGDALAVQLMALDLTENISLIQLGLDDENHVIQLAAHAKMKLLTEQASNTSSTTLPIGSQAVAELNDEDFLSDLSIQASLQAEDTEIKAKALALFTKVNRQGEVSSTADLRRAFNDEEMAVRLMALDLTNNATLVLLAVEDKHPVIQQAALAKIKLLAEQAVN